MPPTFHINPAVIPMVRTRKALLILDLQNDFLSPDGALYVEEPDRYVERILEVAKAFRHSGAGDVIWVRSEFERHCSLAEDGEQIITADGMLRQNKAPPPRGRKATSTAHDGAAMENDEEAFLSIGTRKDKKVCVRKGTKGAEFAPDVKAAVVAGRDIVFTKTHYSAFAPGQPQLVQLLRGRFVTQMYVCGALTNVSIYATAVGAGQHGYDVTLVEDCCGYRSTMRHLNAVRQLAHMTGCEAVSSEGLLEQLQSSAPVPQATPASTGLSPSISKISLELGGGPPAQPNPTPNVRRPRAAPPQPDRDDDRLTTPPTPPRRRASNQSTPSATPVRPVNDTGHLEAGSDISSSDSESTHNPLKKVREEKGNARPATAQRSELESSQGPALLPGARRPEAEEARVDGQHSTLDKKSSAPSSRDIANQQEPESDKTDLEVDGESEDAPKTEPEPELKPPHVMDDQHTPIVGEPLCEGDTNVITNVLPSALAADAFERLLEEVSWAGMSHMGGEVPRRIAVQGAVAADGSMPVYRHPADESPPLLPFSPTVLQIKAEVEKHLGHELNHVLIQHYRSGNDYISEHSDKTLDIAKGSFIANVSLGAERTMVFRTKRPPRDAASQSRPASSEPAEPPTTTTTISTTTTTPEPKRQTHRAPLPHNSLLRMGLKTNTTYTHAIRQDKRADRDKSPAELAYAGQRISLTFRLIHTFIDASQTLIWGQGATSKTREGARRVVNGQTEEAVGLLRAFGRENNTGAGIGTGTGGGAVGGGGQGGWDWEGVYGRGFDVLHMGVPKRFFSCAIQPPSSSSSSATSVMSGMGTREAEIANARVGIALAELGVGCAKGSVEGEVRFEDNDPGRAVVEGQGSVLRYLDAVYGAGRRFDQMLPGEVARRVVRLQRGLDLWGVWRGVVEEVGLDGFEGKVVGEEVREKVKKGVLGRELDVWEAWAAEAAAAATTEGDKTSSEGHKKPPSDSKDAVTAPATTSNSNSFYIAATSQPSPADFALWPVLHHMVRLCGEELLGEHLRRYYAAFKERSSVAKALGQLKE